MSIYNGPTKYEYRPRLDAPSPSGSEAKFYKLISSGGLSTCTSHNANGSALCRAGLNVFKNCVGYAWGRFNEIGEGHNFFLNSNGKHKFIVANGLHTGKNYNSSNPPCSFRGASNFGLKTGSIPKLGALIIWKKNENEGHIAVVEQIHSDGSITTSESGYGGGRTDGGWDFGTVTYSSKDYTTVLNGSWWNNGSPKRVGNWLAGSYKFVGFIYNPAVPDYASPGVPVSGSAPSIGIADSVDAVSSAVHGASGASASSTSKIVYDYETKIEKVAVKRARTVDYAGTLNQTKSTSLLTYPTNVESPFILLTVGDVTFGTYETQRVGSKLYVNYPNFIQSLEVEKTNGQINEYKINLVYKIQQGDDPNLIDKIFSSVGYGKVKISYGDFNAPNFIYKDEEAIILKLTSNVDFSSAKITYTLLCTSTAFGAMGSSFYFGPTKDKPSNVIKKILFSEKSKYGLTQIFTGMKSWSQVVGNGWIATNDKTVNIEAKDNIDPLSYINYLVTCMICDTNKDDDILVNSSYYMTIMDDVYGDNSGPYFTVKQIYSSTKTIHNSDVYEVDIGFPSETNVVSFNVKDDQSYAQLYNYSEAIKQDLYSYNIDNYGRVVTDYSPSYSRSSKNFITTPSQKTWWTTMTKFPISATLVIKGLLRPAMLMSYVKVNAFFFGHRHISSGLYFIERQVDNVDSRGYRTTLTLTRFAGDEDAITTEMEERQYIIAKPSVVTRKSPNSGGSSTTFTVTTDPYANNPNYIPDKNNPGWYFGLDGTYVKNSELVYRETITEDGKKVTAPDILQDYDKAALEAGIR